MSSAKAARTAGAYVPAALGEFGTGAGQEEFPILCETCLGPNPYIRMTREKHGKACKICDRPFTVYRWQPGPAARFKKTELCHTCAKLKNVCQTCVLDLQYGLPVEVRDSALEEWEKPKAPTSDVNREYQIEQIERDLTHGTNLSGLVTHGAGSGTEYGKAPSAAAAMLEKLKRTEPYYKRNMPHVCSFFVKGTCNRGKLCPYRHEMPVDGELAHQNIKDRYAGQNDPVARKMLRRVQNPHGAPEVASTPPEDKSVTTLWVGGLNPEKIKEMDLKLAFGKYGECSVRVVEAKQCAFVTFALRDSAEAAMTASFNKLEVNGVKLKLSWGKRAGSAPPPGAAGMGAGQSIYHSNPNQFLTPPPPGMMPPPPPGTLPPGMSLPPGMMMPPPPPGMGGPAPAFFYPSQDPRNLTAKLPGA